LGICAACRHSAFARQSVNVHGYPFCHPEARRAEGSKILSATTHRRTRRRIDGGQSPFGLLQDDGLQMLKITVTKIFSWFRFRVVYAVAACTFLTALLISILILFVDLKPAVGENFFFSSDDPQFIEDKMISEIFPQWPQIIIAAKGDMHDPQYLENTLKITEDLEALEDVIAVQSLARGPRNVQDALDSPLWNRFLISKDHEATFISIFTKNVPPETMIPQFERIVDRHNQPSFELTISGAPYIMESIRRKLLKDLKIFTAAAVLIFGIVLFFVFRSVQIVLGTLLSCVSASALTLIFAQIMRIEIGPLTANLSTIVFVLTLSQIVFLTFNWREISRDSQGTKINATKAAIRMTIQPSFWSMLTTLLGFGSLLFVQATPLKQMGVSGSLGTLVSFVAAYTIYPWFLRLEEERRSKPKPIQLEKIKAHQGIRRAQAAVALSMLVMAGVLAFGIPRVNMDPDLFSYFKKGSELREGLEYIDKNGGSNPLKVVVMDKDGVKFTTRKAYEAIWRLQKVFESDPSVGNVVSLPVILAEAKRFPLASLLNTEWLVRILEGPQFGEVAKYFINEDRDKAYFLLRMNEGDRYASRLKTVEFLKKAVEYEGLEPVLVGGVYLLQGKLAQLLTSSLVSGLGLLVVMFGLMGWLLSRSLRTLASMLLSLCLIPICMIGLVGYLGIPLDIISAPAANLAIAMGVDAMIHMLILVRRLRLKGMGDRRVWYQAITKLWKPIFSSMLVICAGFGIFGFSNFPPTQRFGLSVVIGSVLAALVTLFVLPWLSTLKWRKMLGLQNKRYVV